MSKSLEIARTIIAQFGRGFTTMVGAKDLVALSENENQAGGVTFKIGRNAKGINKVVVRLTWADVYVVEFYKVRKMEAKLVSKHEDVYCDYLAPIFEEATGMYTSL